MHKWGKDKYHTSTPQLEERVQRAAATQRAKKVLAEYCNAICTRRNYHLLWKGVCRWNVTVGKCQRGWGLIRIGGKPYTCSFFQVMAFWSEMEGGEHSHGGPKIIRAHVIKYGVVMFYHFWISYLFSRCPITEVWIIEGVLFHKLTTLILAPTVSMISSTSTRNNSTRNNGGWKILWSVSNKLAYQSLNDMWRLMQNNTHHILDSCASTHSTPHCSKCIRVFVLIFSVVTQNSP